MKQKIYTYARNNGDGSCSISVYPIEKMREEDILGSWGKTIEEIQDGCSYDDGYLDDTYIEFYSEEEVMFAPFTIYSEA